MKKSIVGRVTKAVVDVFLCLGVLCTASVPYFGIFFWISREGRLMTAVLFTSGICAVYILYNFRRMFKTLSEGDPFVKENIARFGNMAVACALTALIYTVKCLFLFSVATIAIICVFAIAALFCLTKRDVFAQAVEYKEENDWTV